MPAASAFLNGFGLRAIASNNGWSLKTTYSHHGEVVKYRSYRYQFEVTLTKRKDKTATAASSVIAAMKIASKKTPTVKSQYGNPYRCRITSFTTSKADTTNGSIRIRISGAADRILAATKQ